jgi:hypothetical protein
VKISNLTQVGDRLSTDTERNWCWKETKTVNGLHSGGWQEFEAHIAEIRKYTKSILETLMEREHFRGENIKLDTSYARATHHKSIERYHR